jgi:hypothetical protein
MALVGIVNLAERLLNQTLDSGQQTQPAAQSAKTTAATGAASNAEDQFTPSSQAAATAQDAGLFIVTQFSLFSAAADFLLAGSAAQTPQQNNLTPQNSETQQNAAQNTTLNTEPNAAAGTNGANANVAAQNTTKNATTQNAAQNAPANTGVTGANTTATNGGLNGAASAQQELQSLNASLAALGLSQSEISAIDRIASIINDFNPTAFTSLVYQLEAAAQAVSQQNAAPTSLGSVNTATTNAPTTNATTTNAPAANSLAANTGNTNGAKAATAAA